MFFELIWTNYGLSKLKKHGSHNISSNFFFKRRPIKLPHSCHKLWKLISLACSSHFESRSDTPRKYEIVPAQWGRHGGARKSDCPPNEFLIIFLNRLESQSFFFQGVGGVTSDAFGNVIFVTKCLAPSRVLIFFDISNFAICKRMRQKQSLLTVKDDGQNSYQ